MVDQAEQAEKNRTAWHPLLVFLLERFVPAGRLVHCEFLLNRLPQRVDIVVVEQPTRPVTPARKLRSIFDHLRKHTLIEFKGATDDLERCDVPTLLAYGGQYMAMHELYDPEELLLMVIADHISAPFVEQVERMAGKFVPTGNGLWQGRIAGLPMHGVALRDAWKSSSSEWLLSMFTRSFADDPRDINVFDAEDLVIYTLLVQHIAQARRRRTTMLDVSHINLKDPMVQDAFKQLLAVLTPEERLDGLEPEQIVAGLAPEQRLAGLGPEQRLAGLGPEQRLAGLKPEQIADILPPEVIEIIARKLAR